MRFLRYYVKVTITFDRRVVRVTITIKKAVCSLNMKTGALRPLLSMRTDHRVVIPVNTYARLSLFSMRYLQTKKYIAEKAIAAMTAGKNTLLKLSIPSALYCTFINTGSSILPTVDSTIMSAIYAPIDASVVWFCA